MEVVLSSGVKEFEYELYPDEEEFVKVHLTIPKEYARRTWEERVLDLLTRFLDRYSLGEIQESKKASYFHISNPPVAWLGAKRIWPELGEFIKNYFKGREEAESLKV